MIFIERSQIRKVWGGEVGSHNIGKAVWIVRKTHKQKETKERNAVFVSSEETDSKIIQAVSIWVYIVDFLMFATSYFLYFWAIFGF